MNSTKILIATLALFCLNSAQAQLSGNVQLVGQANHSGVKIKFIASSGTAITDSTLSDAAGDYSLNIAGGNYQVEYSKNGFQTHLYPYTGVTVLTNTVVMPSVTLQQGIAVYVAGSVSGNWTSGITYYVYGDIQVPPASTLNIQPGVTVMFLGNYTLTANGNLNVAGSGNNPVRFTAIDTTKPWAGIILNGGAHIFNYCEFSHYGSISGQYADITLTNSRLSYANHGITMLGGNTTIQDNEFYNTKTTAIGGDPDVGIISCNRLRSPLYKNNFHDINRGLNINGFLTFTDNEVSEFVEGIFFHPMTDGADVSNNYIHGNRVGINIFGSYYTPTLSIAGNTIYDNLTGISSTHTALTVANNIIASCEMGITGKAANIKNNLLFDCDHNFSITTPITGLGQIVSTNSNGDPVDPFFNLYMDPEFGHQMPFVKPGSPAQNAGDGTNGSHIGAVYASSACLGLPTGIHSATRATQSQIFPNPSSGEFYVESPKTGQLRIYSIAGSLIHTQEINAGINKVSIAEHTAGVFIAKISTELGESTVRLIMQ